MTHNKLLDFSASDTQEVVIEKLKHNLDKLESRHKKTRALRLLSGLFQQFNFDLHSFIKAYGLTDKQQTRFLSYLLYGIYYNEIYLSILPKDKEFLDCYFLTLLAEIYTEKEVLKLLELLSFKQKIQQIAHCSTYLREGSWIILNGLEKICQNDALLSSFLLKMRTGYYDFQQLNFVIKSPRQYYDLNSLDDMLEEIATMQIMDIKETLPILIDAMIAFPAKGFKRLQSFNDSGKALEEVKVQIDKIQEELREFFRIYLDQTYSFEELRTFFLTFGLNGYYLNHSQKESLNFVLKKLLDLFEHPFTNPQDQFNSSLAFVQSICENLHAFHRDPHSYFHGLRRLIYALPTRGDHLPSLPWLPSVLKGMHLLLRHIKAKGHEENSLKDFPIVIFDQASQKQLKKNKSFIKELTRSYDANIWHLSLRQTIQAAKKLDLASWIMTTPSGFGYGGARNCAFFLAPVIHRAVQTGVKSFNALMKLSKKQLKLFFEEAVLGKNQNDSIIHMGEDDVFIPIGNFFADALIADKHHREYFQKQSLVIGRDTININTQVDFNSILENPLRLFSSTAWQNQPCSGGMKAMMTKPAFCLPLPFGQEERHVATLMNLRVPFEQPVVHLAGPRFPTHLLPVSPLDGILDYLKNYFFYAVEMSMVSRLIDAANASNSCILPWNDPQMKSSISGISSLADLWRYAFSPEVYKEMQTRLWINVKEVFYPQPGKEVQLIRTIQSLIHPDLTLSAPQELVDFYNSLQEDAKCFLALGKVCSQYNEEGVQQPLEKATAEIEKQHKVNVTDLQLTGRLVLLIRTMTSFGSSSDFF